MKNLIALLLLFFTFITTHSQQKVYAVEDTFIEGGASKNTIFGKIKPNILRIGHSGESSKYARITYLKFLIPENLDVHDIDLVLNIKVFKKKDLPYEKFNLTVFAVEDDNWKENSIKWKTPLKLGTKIASVELDQSNNDKTSKKHIKLDADKLIGTFYVNSKFSLFYNPKGKRRRSKGQKYLTLALASYDSKVSAIVTSKDKSKTLGPYLEF